MGDEECRKEVADYFNSISYSFGSKHIFTKDHVAFFNSTTEAFYEIMKLICSPKDVVIFTSPTYGLFTFIPERFGALSKFLPLFESDNWYPNPSQLERLIKDINSDPKYNRVVAFININPHNPTGKVMGR